MKFLLSLWQIQEVSVTVGVRYLIRITQFVLSPIANSALLQNQFYCGLLYSSLLHMNFGFYMVKGVLHPYPKIIIFCALSQIINTFLKIDMCIL